MPDTTPVPETTVATEVVALVQLPPGMLALSVLALPTHIPDEPEITAVALTVIILVAIQLPIA